MCTLEQWQLLHGHCGAVKHWHQTYDSCKGELVTVLLLTALQHTQVFDRMAATGKLELPTELLITLSTLENVVTSPYLTAELSPRGGLVSPRGGLLSPRGATYTTSPQSLPCSPALAQFQGSGDSIASSGSQRASSPGRSISPNRVSCTLPTGRATSTTTAFGVSACAVGSCYAS